MSGRSTATGTVLIIENANDVTDVAVYGLSAAWDLPFVSAIGVGMRTIGMAGKETLGGRLVVTTDGLGFSAHALNRVGGVFVPVSAVASFRDVSKGLTRELEVVRTNGFPMECVVWGSRRSSPFSGR
jgi:hypothetical protein